MFLSREFPPIEICSRGEHPLSSGSSVRPQSPGGMPSGPRKSSAVKVIFGIVGGFVGLVFLMIIAGAGLGFFLMHKAKQEGLDPELIRKNRSLAMAEMEVIKNPDVQMISSNDSAGTMVIRDRRTGKKTTLKFDPEKKMMVAVEDRGKASETTVDANAAAVAVNNGNAAVKVGGDAGNFPSWLPVYPGAAPQNTASVSENGKQSGTYVFLSQDSAGKILGYYSDQFTAANMKLTRSASGSDRDVITATQDDNGRTIAVTASSKSDGTHVSVTYEGKAEQGQL